MSSTSTSPAGSHVSLILRVLGVVGVVFGLSLALPGAYLIFLGGSWYYAIAGLLTVFAGIHVFAGKPRGIAIYLLVCLITVLWSAWEVWPLEGWFWPLIPRLFSFAFALCLILLAAPLMPAYRGDAGARRGFLTAALVVFAGLAVTFWQMFHPHDIVRKDFTLTPGAASPDTMAAGDNWTAYGRTGMGTRYAPFDQITPENVGQLEIAWTARTGHIADDTQYLEDQNTPLYADGTVFQCSADSAVTAIDGVSGEIKWQFDSGAKNPFWKRCRTLGYFDPGPGDACGPRIVLATVDVRMIALKASDGQICESFGNQGTVDLHLGMGDVEAGYLTQTTGAIVAGDKILIGGWVADNVKVDEPSGVVRAFDAKTGAFAWAFDVGNLGNQGLPPAGGEFTRGTPNVWAPISADVELGLAYLPVGNATPDYYGGKRRPFDDEYNASVVAVELATGKERWHFRTVHHDIWDYDVPAQPALIEFPDGKGGSAPAVLQLTKRGQIFVLDRRTGVPLVETIEKPVPGGDGTAEGEYYAPTQPYPVVMASVGTEPLTEARMWGATPIDQLLCRILFKGAHYKGDFTPQSTRPTIVYPGNNGGPNWGSGGFDEERNIFVVSDSRMPVYSNLIPRSEFPADFKSDPHGEISPQFGLPYAQKLQNFFSPIGIPCLEPPWGTVTGIDLATRQIIWQRPAGTSEDVTVLGAQPHLSFFVGMPPLGGPVMTKGGIVFHSGTQDYYLRAYDVETGDELWKGRLPTGSQATPMSYVGADGRQYIALTAGGARDNPNDRGDYVIAFALPKTN
ncbi:membrane-bound PQQ-dependent dehydrogenase, glucose/quinate/shikimate family [Paracoccus lutimaris]|uniref:Quinoprotein glucose dehydrogenase n=1 Tax=Paracoccus lutimaris TaxID=1490030 RepID=A0A368Z8Q2_9RHOB|nr:membrane-bound PQQ-dependent dehydrogenase, glucose/quinate/shikimate family [Paracoccus lutimaris]RCW88840.1 quinoprotein glucose dehydrogenase [Paracoccus lutimaris]